MTNWIGNNNNAAAAGTEIAIYIFLGETVRIESIRSCFYIIIIWYIAMKEAKIIWSFFFFIKLLVAIICFLMAQNYLLKVVYASTSSTILNTYNLYVKANIYIHKLFFYNPTIFYVWFSKFFLDFNHLGFNAVTLNCCILFRARKTFSSSVWLLLWASVMLYHSFALNRTNTFKGSEVARTLAPSRIIT